MTCWVVIPVKGPDEGKQRLAAALDPARRTKLVRAMLERVVAAAQGARQVDEVCLLGSSRHGLPEGIPLLPDPGTGLNPALTSAFVAAKQAEATRLVIVFADLPQLTSLDIELLVAAPEDEVAIAPDRHGTGTNAISLPLPAAEDFAFAFGPDSFALHSAEARRLGLGIEEVRSRGLAHDIDEPDDLPDAGGLLGD
ncbi:MAG: 2-phospho-L-lactate guanylyltransferase [Novosphingobium sp.]